MQTGEFIWIHTKTQVVRRTGEVNNIYILLKYKSGQEGLRYLIEVLISTLTLGKIYK